MNNSILTQILNEKANPGTICRLKSSFDCPEEARHYMDGANAISGVIGHLQQEIIKGQLKYNVHLMLYNQFDKQQFKDFIEGFESIEIIPTAVSMAVSNEKQ
ncbi:hypothetical protein [Legionella parisiensis]|uniref:Uncharacterized protein n=1 Tax=Legionella parisiensis TaxID=45071 RepID=A0A1E5JN94_9GAMM|nr:hypothetical protein [Legionella parisiensis]KTD42881.1 hypothetical protein Lpar_0858 [Legionella parisiensis]OEH46006.1 hypothetical protein lpari_03059 [Legionella parisiensis]STX78045.1 Uncharacterised protein [Legionella parisiensis]